jgi:hypothetical protein
MHTASREIQQNVSNNDIRHKCTVYSENYKVSCTISLHTHKQNAHWPLATSCYSNNNGEQAGQSSHKMCAIIPLEYINNVFQRLNFFKFIKQLSCCAHKSIICAKENKSKGCCHIFTFVQTLSCICCMWALGFPTRRQTQGLRVLWDCKNLWLIMHQTSIKNMSDQFVN